MTQPARNAQPQPARLESAPSLLDAMLADADARPVAPSTDALLGLFASAPSTDAILALADAPKAPESAPKASTPAPAPKAPEFARWRKIGDTWHVSAPGAAPGDTVTVQARNGRTARVKLGREVSPGVFAKAPKARRKARRKAPAPAPKAQPRTPCPRCGGFHGRYR